MGDIAFLVEDIYRGRSAVSGIPTKLVLVRWRKPPGSILLRIGDGQTEQKSSRVRLGDLVCMTKEEAQRHLKEVVLGEKTHEALYEEATIEKIDTRLREAATYEQIRS
jgi:tRNA threonylcarbamoyladenosine dehydratase